MKLYYSVLSPFARKCLVSAHELGLAQRLELIVVSATPTKRDATLVARNPLGKVPTLESDEGEVLYDSAVICEYLNERGGGRLLPPSGAPRYQLLVEQALGDGLMDAAILVRYETALRPQELRWSDWVTGQQSKMLAALHDLERRASGFAARVDLGTITAACALGYLDLRYAALGWREHAPRAADWFQSFSERPSMQATHPPPV